MTIIKVYSEPDHAPSSDWRLNLVMIMKAHWGDGTDWDRGTVGYLCNWFQLVDDMRDADICVLPLAWNYYVKHGKIDRARDLAARALRAGKQIAVWSEGDHGARLPFGNALLFQYDIWRSQRYDSARRIYQYARAPFTRDYLAEYSGGQLAIRDKRERPLIGFCGNASVRGVASIYVRNIYRQLRARVASVPFEPPDFQLSAHFRTAILHRLSASPHVDTCFVIRDHYGGKQHNADTVREYVENIRDTDYTICMRGTGNYSIRFCEILSMGRIPIFVDTDCALPYDFEVDWRAAMLWVDVRDLDRIGEIVAEFHARLSPDDFVALQRACRRLWEERLTQESYYRHFHEHLRHAGVITA
jgi:hypothetical protein